MFAYQRKNRYKCCIHKNFILQPYERGHSGIKPKKAGQKYAVQGILIFDTWKIPSRRVCKSLFDTSLCVDSLCTHCPICVWDRCLIFAILVYTLSFRNLHNIHRYKIVNIKGICYSTEGLVLPFHPFYLFTFLFLFIKLCTPVSKGDASDLFWRTKRRIT